MPDIASLLGAHDPEERTRRIVDTLTDAFSHLMAASPAAFRAKFRTMAADPFAFYRGSASLFYADVARLDDPWADERTSRVWIQGDLHAENFGTYMDSDGQLVFDVNDFDEAYLGHFTWDVQRLAASVDLLGWRKALPDDVNDELVAGYVRAYLDAIRSFTGDGGEVSAPLGRHNTSGAILQALRGARTSSRLELLTSLTETEGDGRIFRAGPGVRRLHHDERAEVVAAYARYLETIPSDKRLPAASYRVVDVVGRSGFGIGSAGLPAYNVLIEGFSEALDNDVVLSMKQAVQAAASRVVTDERITGAFQHQGHRTAVSQRALQAHSDRLLGWTAMRGVGYVVTELSPYVSDLDWSDLTEPDQIGETLGYLGAVTARAHCVSDADDEHSLVDFQVEEAVTAVVGGREDEFVESMTTFAREYAAVVRSDHALFVEAFRNDRIPGVSSRA